MKKTQMANGVLILSALFIVSCAAAAKGGGYYDAAGSYRSAAQMAHTPM